MGYNNLGENDIVIRGNAWAALERIAKEGDGKLNKIRVRRFGLNVD